MRDAAARRPAHPSSSPGPGTGTEPAASPLLAELDTLLEAQIQVALRLRAALSAEHAALVQRDAAAVATSCRDKARVVEDMTRLERQRRDLCLRLGAGPGWPELAAWIEAFSDGGAFPARMPGRVTEVTALLRDCRAAHSANGSVAAMLHRRVQQAEDLLRGNSGGAAPGRVAGPVVETDPGRDIWRQDLT